jgi:hypothetical protein
MKSSSQDARDVESGLDDVGIGGGRNAASSGAEEERSLAIVQR